MDMTRIAWSGLILLLATIALGGDRGYASEGGYRVFTEDGQEATHNDVTLTRTRREASNTSTNTSPNPLSNAKIVKDSHKYYRSTVIIEREMADNYKRAFKEAYEVNYKRHSLLSNSHRIALQVKMSFDFLFYGHKVNKVTIATGGFLYMSHYLHKYLTYSQYIAPLMADFDTGIGSGDVKYADTGDAFFVLWEKVHLKNQHSVGSFTFQAILHRNGTIVFAYQEVPLEISKIQKNLHVVRVGIADAYYNDTDHPTNKAYFTRRIVQYDQITIPSGQINSNTVVILHPLETCVQQSTCDKCLTAKTSFNCAWCDRAGRCSSGTDRLKQSWMNKKCHEVNRKANCPITPAEAGLIVFIVLLCLMLVAVMGAFGYWVYYAYTHPATPSGIWLMEHRPSIMISRFSAWRRGGNNDSSDIYRVESTA